MKFLSLLVGVLLTTSINAQCEPNWLSTDGNKLVDINGEEVILAGVNWFGFETQISIPHGLYARDIDGMLKQIKDLGFNCIRLPWHNGMLRDGAKFEAPNYWVDNDPFVTYDGSPGPYSNLALRDMKTPLEIMDYLIDWCQENDIRVILDCHSRNPDAYLIEKLWFTDTTSEQQWIDDWVFIANRYKNKSAVIGMDINNEPNGKIDNPEGARWGTNNQYDWRLASEKCGNAILKVNPNVLIMVEGIEAYRKPNGDLTSYWWGGNLQGARDYPVRLSNPKKLMYSPHEYGPTVFDQVWFSAPDFPENMPEIWETQFNFLNTNGTSPLLIGELGIKGQGGKDEIWFQKFIDYIKEKKLHYTFWAMNPNSGDTGGILANDWRTVVQWKMDYLKPILQPIIPNCIEKKTLSVSEIFKDDINSFKVSPNPSKGPLNISLEKKLESVSVYNMAGQKIDNYENINSNNLDLDLSDLNEGVYILKAKVESKTHTLKIVKK